MKTIESVKEKFVEVANVDCQGKFEDWPELISVIKVNKVWSFIEQSIKEVLEATKLKKDYFKPNISDEFYNGIVAGYNKAVTHHKILIDKYLNKR